MARAIFVYLALVTAGAAAGVINGMIGVGGGIVIVYVLSYFYRGAENIEKCDIFSTAVASVLPMSAVSVFVYTSRGEPFPDMNGYILPAVLGGAAGAFFLDKISSLWLKRIFSLLVIWAGISLFMKGMKTV